MSEQKREWLPTKWWDEGAPAPQIDVNAFVRQLPNGEFRLIPVGDRAITSRHNDELTQNQIIEFSALETFEKITLTVTEDGFSTFPSNLTIANNFHLEGGESEDVFNSVEETVENGGERLEPGSYEVECWWWSDQSFSYQFTIDADGKGWLQPCEGAN
ncbi:hypothetical protein FS799_00960 [Agrobacterium vitis]|uniref:hypothetical protein n=1 Tax=Agrobacterium vitis TaxID=373 RepID=UPI001F2C7C2B|nr:hypothetical protein [Agrobacterium vitis]MCE6073426.1 hypothetical protein [Agrobacterium vitis]